MPSFQRPDWDGARNAADLGGLPLIGGGATAYGRVWRSAAPEWMTPAGWQAALADGVTHIVDLRNEAERGRRPEHPEPPAAPTGITVIGAPTEDPDDAAFLKECGPWLDHPRSWTPNARRYPEKFARIFSAIASIAATGGGVLIHCAGGRDRTGMVTSMLLDLNGVEADAIAANYEHGFRGAAAHRGHGLAYDADTGEWITAPDVARTPEELDDALAERVPAVHAWLAKADVAGYLRAAGLDAADLRRLAVLLR